MLDGAVVVLLIDEVSVAICEGVELAPGVVDGVDGDVGNVSGFAGFSECGR